MNEHFFDKWGMVYATKGSLPHWHLSLSMSRSFLYMQRIYDKKEIELLKWEKYNRIEKYLDKGNGECFLNNLECRNIVAQALLHFDNVRYKIVSYVIMPNHVHVVLMPYGEWMVQDIIKSIKHYSALRINRLLGRVGQVWQKESFDRIIRDEQHYQNILKYIYNNPRNLTKDTFSLYFAENLI